MLTVRSSIRSYVVDCADPESIEQSRHELHELVSKPSLAGIPVLVLGNKNDVDGALQETELIEQMCGPVPPFPIVVSAMAVILSACL